MDYIKARTYIDESHRFGGEMGLEAITCLLEKLGDPQETLQFIHIAGTNGKGSVGAYLAAVLQEAGYRIVYNPFAMLYHYESKTRGKDDTDEKWKLFQKESNLFTTRWQEFLKKGDPYYNPNLTLIKHDFSLKMQ